MSSAETDLLINAEGLVAGYGRKAVLDGVSFKFRGGATGLLGPNGAGKSTLIKTVLGLIPPMAGSLSVLGQALPRAANRIRERIGYMPETESFIPGMNAVNFVTYMAQISGLPRAAAVERAHEVLQYVGLGESRYRNVETYSDGMKQRAKLAQAIVHDPLLLLLDEPTNGMDPPGRVDMLELVNDLSRNKGVSVILCSHLLKDVEAVADEIVVLGNGQVIAKRMNRLDDAPRERIYIVRVRGPLPEFTAAMQQRGAHVIPEEGGTMPAFRLPAQIDTTVFFSAAEETGCLVQRLHERTENLEDLFVQAIGELGNAHL